MLLSDAKVQQLLQTDVVPVWESVREVPKVTIDFGQGRVLKRTLKGNTVMYLCRPDGGVVDAFPGVFTPTDFLAEIQPSLAAANSPGLQEWHWKSFENRIETEHRRITLSKAFVESPLLAALEMGQPKTEPRILAPPRVDPSDRRGTFKRLTRALEDLSDRAMSPRATRSAMFQTVRSEQGEDPAQMAIREDSKRNREVVRPAVHLLLSTFDKPCTPREIQRDLFVSLLGVKLDDPYLGLADVSLPGTPKQN